MPLRVKRFIAIRGITFICVFTTKQGIRNHRRLAIISDYSYLAPPAGLEPATTKCAVGNNGQQKPPVGVVLVLS